MAEQKLEIKIAFITGLKEVVLSEIAKHKDFHVTREDIDSIYLEYKHNLILVKQLRSVARAYIVVQNVKYNPLYIANHKSILGNLIKIVLSDNEDNFQYFKISCAGSDSKEVRSIAKYIQMTYGLIEKQVADLKIHILNSNQIWEIGIQITPRPLSIRDYKIANMAGAIDPTIAYAVNSFCELEKVKKYLNIFSGSATLLIEAAQCYPNIEHLVGFDNDKKHLSLAIQNIKKAKLIKSIKIKERNIFDKPNLGTFDAITSDLPFGMSISKGENLERLYQSLIEYCENALTKEGKLAVYTSEHEILENIILKSRFSVINKLELRLMTNVNAYLRPKIFICKIKR
jgi:23S rRNA G2445 N2-methylase RlmL